MRPPMNAKCVTWGICCVDTLPFLTQLLLSIFFFLPPHFKFYFLLSFLQLHRFSVSPLFVTFLTWPFLFFADYPYFRFFWYLPEVCAADDHFWSSLHGWHRPREDAGKYCFPCYGTSFCSIPQLSPVSYIPYWFHNDEELYSTPLIIWLCCNEDKHNFISQHMSEHSTSTFFTTPTSITTSDFAWNLYVIPSLWLMHECFWIVIALCVCLSRPLSDDIYNEISLSSDLNEDNLPLYRWESVRLALL